MLHLLMLLAVADCHFAQDIKYILHIDCIFTCSCIATEDKDWGSTINKYFYFVKNFILFLCKYHVFILIILFHKTYLITIKYHITFASLAIIILGNNDFSLSSQSITIPIHKYIISGWRIIERFDYLLKTTDICHIISIFSAKVNCFYETYVRNKLNNSINIKIL